MTRLLRTLALALTLVSPAALAGMPVNINTADASELEQVKGIGPVKAQAILDYRRQHGPFARVEDLVRVPGIGEKTVLKLREQVTAGGGPEPKFTGARPR